VCRKYDELADGEEQAMPTPPDIIKTKSNIEIITKVSSETGINVVGDSDRKEGIYIYICIYIYVYIHICIYICIHIYIHIYVCIYIYVYIYIYIYICIYIGEKKIEIPQVNSSSTRLGGRDDIKASIAGTYTRIYTYQYTSYIYIYVYISDIYVLLKYLNMHTYIFIYKHEYIYRS
jgi:hypothetical protein